MKSITELAFVEIMKGIAQIALIVLVVFLVLKGVGVVEWPWIWVLSPAWLPGTTLFILSIVILFWKRNEL